LFRPAPDVSYNHIDELFTAQVDWDLIATLVPDMMRVAVSIRTGNILPSDILRRLNSSSRKNKLYFGLRELGRVRVLATSDRKPPLRNTSPSEGLNVTNGDFTARCVLA
jgi:TnpA family transposase